MFEVIHRIKFLKIQKPTLEMPKEVFHHRVVVAITLPAHALLDAVGRAVRHIGNIHKYARDEDRPEKTLFVITTDGMENASREFIFLGANIDAAKEAVRFGIDEDRAVNYHADRQVTAVIYEAVSEAVCCVREARPMSSDWRRKVDEDYEKRGL